MNKEEAMKILKDFHDKSALFSVRTALDTIIPELCESEDERIRKAILELVRQSSEILDKQNQNNMLAWLEKQGEKKSVDKEYTFKSIPRLLDMIEPTDRAKSYCKKLIDSLQTEGYVTDAKIVSDCLKQMNGEKVAMAVMDIEKQGCQKSQRTISAEAKEALYDKPTDEEMKELLRTEYEKGRADAIVDMYVPTQISPEESLGVSSEKYMDIVDTLTQGGQKPAKWSLGDERVIAIINNALTESNTPPDDYDKVYDWLESLRQRIGG